MIFSENFVVRSVPTARPSCVCVYHVCAFRAGVLLGCGQLAERTSVKIRRR